MFNFVSYSPANEPPSSPIPDREHATKNPAASPFILPPEYFNSLKFIHVICAMLFAAVVGNIPWENVRDFQFIDRENYYYYFTYGQNILEYTKLTEWYHYLTNEVLWHLTIPYILSKYNVSITLVFDCITQFTLFTFALFLSRNKGLAGVLLLFNPLLMTLAFDQLRSALSFSLLLWAYMLPKKMLPIALMLVLAAPLIHTSSILFVLIYACLTALSYVQSKFSLNKLIVVSMLVFAGLIMSLAFGELFHYVLSLVGDRRAERVLADSSSGIKYTSFWFLFLVLILFQRPDFFNKITRNYSVIILSFVSFNTLFGGYSLRFLAVSLPFLVITMLELNRISRFIAITLFAVYASIQWYYWYHVGMV